MRALVYFFAALIIAPLHSAFSQDGKAFSIPVEATIVKGANKSITITWNPDDRATEYIVYRKDPQSYSWMDQTAWDKPLEVLPKTALSYTDTDIEEGTAYEYQIIKRCVPAGIKTLSLGNTVDTVTTYLGSGYVSSGIYVPAQLHRGTVLLFIDSTIVSPLAQEIETLKKDLAAELWNIQTFIVPRTEQFNGQAVHDIKQKIKETYDNNTDERYSVFLLGRIAVPYSGLIYPDGHPDHNGAWPADVFYGDIDGEWTDNFVNNSVASRQENKNIPDDGKFDKSELEADIRIPVGRVDFYNLPGFKESEIELLRRYLNKNHAFRTGKTKPVLSAIVDDNFGAYGEGFSGSAYRSFGPLVGKDNFQPTTEFLDSTQSVMFAFGCGAGSYTSCSGVGSITEFSSRPVNAVFTIIFGSYFGDWDTQNNVMRSVVASRGSVLTTGWASRPHWNFHTMGMGGTIGDVLLSAQNNTQQYLSTIYYTKKYTGGIFYQVAPRGTHIALIGDPTLRMTSNLPITSPLNIGVVSGGVDAQINWDLVPSASGYLVYKSASENGPFTLLTPNPIMANTYQDIQTKKGDNVVYQVRSVALRETKSGCFYEASTPVTSQKITVDVNEEIHHEMRIMSSPQPMSNSGILQCIMPHQMYAEIGIYSLDGRLVSFLVKGQLQEGAHSFIIPADEIPTGMYMIRMVAEGRSLYSPLIITR